MKNVCALIPLLVALPVAGGCVGAKPVQSAAGEGGSGATGTGTGAGGSTGSGGSHLTGSGGGGLPTGSGGGGGDVGPASDASANCGLQQFAPTPKAADIMMVLDRSGSMNDVPSGAPSGSTTTKWQIVVPSLEKVVSATDSSISWGLKSFPEAYTDSMTDCAGGVTSAIDVNVAPMDATAENAAITALAANGKGTPTADAITQAAAYLAKLTDTNPKYLLLATDGEPTCIGTTKESSPYTVATANAVTAVGNALKSGFPTFVVGIATDKDSSNTNLNELAMAGGEAIPSANPLASHYYVADDANALVSELQAITGQISTCLFPLNPPPPVLNDDTKLGVYLGTAMTKIPYDSSRTDGWAYTDANDTAVEVFGNWCNQIEAAGAGNVQIIFGCPMINVP
jgi:hypothetical protein